MYRSYSSDVIATDAAFLPPFYCSFKRDFSIKKLGLALSSLARGKMSKKLVLDGSLLNSEGFLELRKPG